jgi:hypothetical protein
MLAAARWIANLAIPRLRDAVREFPDYEVKVIFSSYVLVYLSGEYIDL